MGASPRVGLASMMLVTFVRADVNATECKTLGFAPSLYCSSCDKLAGTIAEGDPLVGECRGCCMDDPVNKGYASATFDVCK
mmetsp:Transcript_30428/g.78929  ORF Transcript_30428/g.78929 Transcript_30428/m.78929 type:complete len:81 (-) Transcript_30428:582-824(-)